MPQPMHQLLYTDVKLQARTIITEASDMTTECKSHTLIPRPPLQLLYIMKSNTGVEAWV